MHMATLYGDTPGQIFWVFLVFAHVAAVLTFWVSRLQALVRKAH